LGCRGGLNFAGFFREVDLGDQVGGDRCHVLVSVNQAGAPSVSRGCDQSVDEGDTLHQCATDIESCEGHSFINRDDLVQQLIGTTSSSNSR
jgi:hypothetical protein